MKFVMFERGGMHMPGVLTPEGDAVLQLQAAFGYPVGDLLSFIRLRRPKDVTRVEEWLAGGKGEPIPLDKVRLLPPIPQPIHDIICVGTNYSDHVKEVQKSIDPAMAQAPQKPIFFTKRAIRIMGPGEGIDSHQALDEELDYEAELAVIIGKPGRDIPIEEAERHIFGYSVFNDVSARTLQREHSQWFRGKSLDTFSVMGPCITHKCALHLPLELDIRSSVNGEERQNSNTRMMIRGVPELVHIISQGMTLDAGDIIATGTPAGVGMGFDPPRYMRPGDTVCCEIQGIGRLCNPIV